MRTYVQLLTACLLFYGLGTTIAAGQDQIPWTQDLQEAQQRAARQGRLVLLHFWDDNCPPCRRLEANVFPDPGVSRTISDNYVPVKIKVRDYQHLRDQFNVRSWPTDVIITPSGEEVFRAVSSQDPVRYVSLLSRVAAQHQVNVPGANNLAMRAPAGRGGEGGASGVVPASAESSAYGGGYGGSYRTAANDPRSSGLPPRDSNVATNGGAYSGYDSGLPPRGQRPDDAAYQQPSRYDSRQPMGDPSANQTPSRYGAPRYGDAPALGNPTDRFGGSAREQGGLNSPQNSTYQGLSSNGERDRGGNGSRYGDPDGGTGREPRGYGDSPNGYRDPSSGPGDSASRYGNPPGGYGTPSSGYSDPAGGFGKRQGDYAAPESRFGAPGQDPGGRGVAGQRPAEVGGSKYDAPGGYGADSRSNGGYADPYGNNRSPETPDRTISPQDVPNPYVPQGRNMADEGRGGYAPTDARGGASIGGNAGGSRYDNSPPGGYAPPREQGPAPGQVTPPANVGPQGNAAPQGDFGMQNGMQNTGPAAPPKPAVALDGYCPVTLVERSQWKKADPKWGAQHRDRVYLFAGPGEQQKFLANPDRYSPVLSGFDPVRFTEQGALVPGKRQHGVSFRNQIYLFADEAALERFWRSPDQYAANVYQAMQRGQRAPVQR